MNLSMDGKLNTNNLNNSQVDIVSRHEELDHFNKTNKQKKIEQISHNLYIQGVSLKAKREKITEEYNIKTQKEKDICMFKPLLIKPKKPIDYEILKLGFVERRDQIKQKFTEKYNKFKLD